ncbi:MAG: MarR family winged helix-turn-helix transcriptional regulator [Woeseiaceae bacterium]
MTNDYVFLEFSGGICHKSLFATPDGTGMHDRSNSALIALRRILRVTELNSQKLAQQADMTASQLIVLQFISRNGKALPSEVAKAVGLKQATVTVLVNKLELAGFVTKRRDTEDRRRVWIELTDAGRTALEKSPDLLQNRFEEGFEKLPDWEQAMIIGALERVASLMHAETLDASPVLDVGDLDRLLDAHRAPKHDA